MIRFFLFSSSLVFFLFFLSSPSYSQTQTKSEREKALELELQRETQKNKEFELKLLEQAFEQAIDPNEYVVGPGDYLLIDLGGDDQMNFQLPVTPEGMLIIPSVGSVRVDGLTLKAIQKHVEKAVLEKYRRTNISTYLIGLRKIRVHVAGYVFNPGTIVATPIDRLSDLIFRAGGFKQNAFLEQIRIRHKDQTESLIDFSVFQNNGDLNHNPIVKSGDIIVVNPIDYSESLVKVEGFLSRPGYYPLKSPGESLFDFLSRHNLLNNNQDITEIAIVRGNKKVIHVDITKQTTNETILRDGDLVTLPKEIRHVYVLGAVVKPGVYQYVENLKAKDYVGQAGSNENASDIQKIKILHSSSGKSEKGGEVLVFPGDIIEVPIRNYRRLSEYLQIASTIATLVIAISTINR